MHRISVTLAASVGLIGCAGHETAPEPISTMLAYVAPIDEAPLGVAEIEPASDVADLSPAYRHVVFPRDSFPPLSKLAAVPSPSAHVRSPAPAPAEPETAGTRQRPPPRDDPVYTAWRKYCIGAQDMTAADWRIIDTSLMPAALSGVWAEECLPLK